MGTADLGWSARTMTARELKRRLITMFSVEFEESDVDRRKLRRRRH